MNIIRSGQDISLATTEDQQIYLDKIEPVSIKGMKYLEKNPSDTQCIQLRWINDLAKDIENDYDCDSESCAMSDSHMHGRAMQTTGFGYFVNLNNLENWAQHHETHLNIFGGSLRELQKGNLQSVYLWDEVFIVHHGYANYINCHNKTGFLPWYANQSL